MNRRNVPIQVRNPCEGLEQILRREINVDNEIPAWYMLIRNLRKDG